ITISSEKLANGCELSFKDNGMGIDLKKDGEQLFGLYKRFHPHIEGKGMGLFMVKAQVEALGGNIRVSSAVNKGATFKVSFVG
ncbi:MAG: ATP-binding protein, partial [Bacteroidia bacterium]